jgi:hypothetical protein
VLKHASLVREKKSPGHRKPGLAAAEGWPRHTINQLICCTRYELERIDQYAKAHGQTRSGFCASAICAGVIFAALGALSEAIKPILYWAQDVASSS